VQGDQESGLHCEDGHAGGVEVALSRPDYPPRLTHEGLVGWASLSRNRPFAKPSCHYARGHEGPWTIGRRRVPSGTEQGLGELIKYDFASNPAQGREAARRGEAVHMRGFPRRS
jgi:hypothetical protein